MFHVNSDGLEEVLILLCSGNVIDKKLKQQLQVCNNKDVAYLLETLEKVVSI